MISIGKEIMRLHSKEPSKKALVEISSIKGEFANLFDKLSEYSQEALKRADEAPLEFSEENIKKHMEVVVSSEELTRCMSEACKYLELACMLAVKGISS